MSNKKEWTEVDENLSKLLESLSYEDTKRRKQKPTNSNVNSSKSKTSKLVYVECDKCKGIGGVGFFYLKNVKDVEVLVKFLIFSESYNNLFQP